MPTSPIEIIELNLTTVIQLTQWLPPKDCVTLLITNQYLRSLLMHDTFWQIRFGSKNKDNFTKTLSSLKHPVLIDSFFSNFISLQKAEETQRLLNLTPEERVAHFFTPEQSTLGGSPEHKKSLMTNDINIIALQEGLVTIAQLSIDDSYTKLLQTKLGQTFLRKIPPSLYPKNKFDITDKLDIILTPNGLKALNEKLITLEEITFASRKDISALLSDPCIDALRDNLFTPNLALTGPYWRFWVDEKKIENYIQQRQVTLLETLLADKLEFPNLTGLKSWFTSAPNNENDLPYFTIKPSIKIMNRLSCLRDKLNEQGISLSIEQTTPGLIMTCHFSDRDFKKIKSALISMPSPDGTREQSHPPTPLSLFNFFEVTLQKKCSAFANILSELFVFHANTVNLIYKPKNHALYFPSTMNPAIEDITRCSDLLKEAGVNFTFVQSYGIAYFLITDYDKQKFKTNIKNLHQKKMGELNQPNDKPAIAIAKMSN